MVFTFPSWSNLTSDLKSKHELIFDYVTPEKAAVILWPHSVL